MSLEGKHIEFVDEDQRARPPHEEAIRKARGMTIHEEENKLNILKTSFFLLIILSMALGLYSFYVWEKFSSPAMLAVSFTCIATFVGSIIGIIGSFRTISEIKYRSEILAKQRKAYGHDILLTSFYFLIVVFVLFVIFGARALFFTEQSISYLEALYKTDIEEWNTRYDELSLDKVTSIGLLMISLSGYTCYLMVILIIMIIYLVYVLSANYEAIHSVIEVINLGVMTLGLSVITLASYCLKYREEMELFDIVSKAVPALMIGLGGLLLATSILGYVMARKEKLGLIKAYTVVCGVLIFACALSTLWAVQNARDYKESLEKQCLDVLAMIDEQFIHTLGCEIKYSVTSSSEDTLDCPKNEVRFIWETEHTGSQYGCLNKGCCYTMIAESKSKFDYLGICPIGAILLLGLAIWGCYFHYKKIEKLGVTPPSLHRADPRILFLMILLPVLSVFYILYFLPPSPNVPWYRDSRVVVEGATLIDARYLRPGFCESLSLPTLEASQSELEFEAYISTSSGEIRYLDTRDSTLTIQATSIKDLLRNLEKVLFCPTCEYSSYSYVTEIWEKSESHEYRIYQAETKYETEEHYTTVSGSVFDQESSTSSSIVAKKENCFSEEQSGKAYEFEFVQAVYSLPYEVNLFFTNTSTISRKVQVGGFPFYSYLLPPTVFPNSIGENFTMDLEAVNVRNNLPLSVDIEVREGYNNYSGPVYTSILKHNKTLSLPGGVYSLVGLSSGYKAARLDGAFEGNENYAMSLPLTPNNFKVNELRVILTWNSEVDLDLRVNFALDSEYTCDISFNNKECGGVKLTAVSSEDMRAEEISIKQVGAYQYLFYVKQFANSTSQIIDSGLKMDVYIGNVLNPVVSVYSNRELSYPEEEKEEYRIWLGFCLNGLKGIESLAPIQSYVSVFDNFNIGNVCNQVYGETMVLFNSTYYDKVKVESDLPPVPIKYINNKS